MRISDIQFNDIELYDCAEAWEKLDPVDRISMSPYELAEFSEVKDIEAWKRFIKYPAVSDYLKEEVKLFTESQQRKLITTAIDNDRSTGASQMITALGKVIEDDTKSKDNGQIFIYSYVPLTEKEENAPNAGRELYDLFNKS